MHYDNDAKQEFGVIIHGDKKHKEELLCIKRISMYVKSICLTFFVTAAWIHRPMVDELQCSKQNKCNLSKSMDLLTKIQ